MKQGSDPNNQTGTTWALVGETPVITVEMRIAVASIKFPVKPHRRRPVLKTS
jgi:hypothetical protein